MTVYATAGSAWHPKTVCSRACADCVHGENYRTMVLEGHPDASRYAAFGREPMDPSYPELGAALGPYAEDATETPTPRAGTPIPARTFPARAFLRFVHENEPPILAPGKLVWHKLTGDGPWVLVQHGDLATDQRVPAAHEGQVQRSGVFLDDVWTVEVAPDVFKAVPAASLSLVAPQPSRRRSRALLAAAVLVVAVFARLGAQFVMVWLTDR
jgi:hypothetical protein